MNKETKVLHYGKAKMEFKEKYMQ